MSRLPVRVLLTGAGGQLGSALQASRPAGIELLACGREQLDLCDPAAVQALLGTWRPQWIINAAAYTAVDRAEAEPARAEAVNASGAGHLAAAAARVGARLVQISTDYVFDGRCGSPYRVDSPRSPLGVYGRSKAEGERQVQAALGDAALILRTAWLYSRHHPCFLRSMLRLLAEREELRVVADQVGSPTHAPGLAGAVWRALDAGLGGIHHWTDSGVASWYDFAVAIQALARRRGLLPREIPIHPIRSDEYPVAAPRPGYSVLDKSAGLAQLGEPRHWMHELDLCLSEA